MSILLRVSLTTGLFLEDLDFNLNFIVFLIQGFHICGRKKYLQGNISKDIVFFATPIAGEAPAQT